MRRIILRLAEIQPKPPMGPDRFALPDVPALADLAQWLKVGPVRLAWIGQFNSTRRMKLMHLFDRIDWPAAPQTPS